MITPFRNLFDFKTLDSVLRKRSDRITIVQLNWYPKDGDKAEKSSAIRTVVKRLGEEALYNDMARSLTDNHNSVPLGEIAVRSRDLKVDAHDSSGHRHVIYVFLVLEDRSDRRPNLMVRLFGVYAPAGREPKVKEMFYSIVDQWREWIDRNLTSITVPKAYGNLVSDPAVFT
jgi:hypothetical protein